MTDAEARDWANSIAAFEKTQTYTVKDAYRNQWITDTDADNVHIEVESETAGDRFQVRIDSDIFDDMTDAERRDYIRKECAWHADHHIDGDNSAPEIESDQQTAMDDLVDEVFKV